MKKITAHFTGTFLVWLMAGQLPADAAHYSEKMMYLGVVNGRVQGNSTVKVMRTLPDPVLFRTAEGKAMPEQLIIRNASARAGGGGTVYVTVRKALEGGIQEARVTLNVTLMADGKKVPAVFSRRGEDVLLAVPATAGQAELRCDTPAELQVPANYRGNLQVVMQTEAVREDMSSAPE